MKLHNAVKDEAILSNVSNLGEFRIRNSAKAFNILSSSLYANKVRAIIRELSTNALDSHVAAKNPEPFVVHLPSALEPWFSVRDYGTGLSHDQVTTIYTTYFESTKTDSNDFVGALGLGSKSPFGYTENFSVTAVKDGIKNIYSAFLNDEGLPSIALMSTAATDEPNGVEVQFAVKNGDYSSFHNEARYVYRWFSQKPSFAHEFIMDELKVEFEDQNIVPGVHSREKSGRLVHSYAIMGNILYPISVPEAEQHFGPLQRLLNCNLFIEFEIGELDFQPSREGLSYIPQTIAAIKRKLEAVGSTIDGLLTKEADQITNQWLLADYLSKKGESKLWRTSVENYIAKNQKKISLLSTYSRREAIKLDPVELSWKFNIKMTAFDTDRHSYRYSSVWRANKSVCGYDPNNGSRALLCIQPYSDTHFITVDTKVGAATRAKEHFRGKARAICIVEPADKTKPALFDDFYQLIHNPPNIILASKLNKIERVKAVKAKADETVFRFERRNNNGYRNSSDLVCRPEQKLGEYPQTETMYYLPIKNLSAVSNFDIQNNDLNGFVRVISNLSGKHLVIRGVPKALLPKVQKLSNWINVDDYVSNLFRNDAGKIAISIAYQMMLTKYNYAGFRKFSNLNIKQLDKSNRYYDLFEILNNVTVIDREYSESTGSQIKTIVTALCNSSTFFAETEKAKERILALNKEYPMLKLVKNDHCDDAEVVNYINETEKQIISRKEVK
jgi:hypothetical protein